jgi:hypothetical protein
MEVLIYWNRFIVTDTCTTHSSQLVKKINEKVLLCSNTKILQPAEVLLFWNAKLCCYMRHFQWPIILNNVGLLRVGLYILKRVSATWHNRITCTWLEVNTWQWALNNEEKAAHNCAELVHFHAAQNTKASNWKLRRGRILIDGPRYLQHLVKWIRFHVRYFRDWILR